MGFIFPGGIPGIVRQDRGLVPQAEFVFLKKLVNVFHNAVIDLVPEVVQRLPALRGDSKLGAVADGLGSYKTGFRKLVHCLLDGKEAVSKLLFQHEIADLVFGQGKVHPA